MSEILTKQHYAFADAFLELKGSKRTFAEAARMAGVEPEKCHIYGARWSKLPEIQDYWAGVRDSLKLRRSLALSDALDKAIDLLYFEGISKSEKDKELSNAEKIDLLKTLLQLDSDLYISPTSAGEPLGSPATQAVSEQTLSTVGDLLKSVEELYIKSKGDNE